MLGSSAEVDCFHLHESWRDAKYVNSPKVSFSFSIGRSHQACLAFFGGRSNVVKGREYVEKLFILFLMFRALTARELRLMDLARRHQAKVSRA